MQEISDGVGQREDLVQREPLDLGHRSEEELQMFVIVEPGDAGQNQSQASQMQMRRRRDGVPMELRDGEMEKGQLWTGHEDRRVVRSDVNMTECGRFAPARGVPRRFSPVERTRVQAREVIREDLLVQHADRRLRHGVRNREIFQMGKESTIDLQQLLVGGIPDGQPTNVGEGDEGDRLFAVNEQRIELRGEDRRRVRRTSIVAGVKSKGEMGKRAKETIETPVQIEEDPIEIASVEVFADLNENFIRK